MSCLSIRGLYKPRRISFSHSRHFARRFASSSGSGERKGISSLSNGHTFCNRESVTQGRTLIF